jgi:RND superfamily putative drug exporter
MAAFPSPERLARFSTRRPWLVVGIWVVVLVAAVASASQIGSVLTTTASIFVETDSSRANEQLEDGLFGGTIPLQETVVVQSESMTVDDPAYVALLEQLTADIRGLSANVASVTNVLETGAEQLVSDDARTTLLPVTLTGDEEDAEDNVKPLIAVLETYDGHDGFTVVTGGDGSTGLAFTETSQEDLETAEFFGIRLLSSSSSSSSAHWSRPASRSPSACSPSSWPSASAPSSAAASNSPSSSSTS